MECATLSKYHLSMTTPSNFTQSLLQSSIQNDSLQNFQQAIAPMLLDQPDQPLTSSQIGRQLATSFLYACRCGSINIVDWILTEAQTSVINSFDAYGQNALMNALHSGNLQIIRYIWIYSPKDWKDSFGNTYLHIATSLGKLELVKLCIQQFGSPLDCNKFGLTALHISTTGEISQYLISKGANVNAQDLQGWTPLHHSIYHRLEESFQVLIENKADIKVRNKDYDTPYDLAIRKGTSQIIMGLLTEANRKYIKSALLNWNFKKIIEKQETVSNLEKESGIQEVLSQEEKVQISQKSNFLLDSPVNLKQSLYNALTRTSSFDLDQLSEFGIDLIQYKELTLKQQIGTGGFGTVYRGYFRFSQVAIKVISPNIEEKTLKDFIKEIQCLIKIRHNRFLLLLGLCLQGPLCIITEIAKGGNLLNAIKHQKLSQQQKLRIAIQIAQGMTFIHNKTPPIVHRDIKPQNILLDEFLQSVKIADLGLSRSIGEWTHTGKLDKTEVCAGTIRYMAPELYQQEPRCTRATDVWAFGCLMFQLMTGEVPWHGLEIPAVQRRLVLKHDFLIDLQIPDPVQSLIRRCCDVNPEKRPRFKEIKQELMACLGIECSQQ